MVPNMNLNVFVCLFFFFISGHVNGVNVIGLSLQGPSVPGLAVMKPCIEQGLSQLTFSYDYRKLCSFVLLQVILLMFLN